ncbi:hypothetical protein LCGC14_2741860 [marine sediment metagenome]|uniref:Uncharacterized protein n=1 Tax=marine sediment metagenome TaxID=412755 RepID=A0A0F8ZRF3_9ZZZZ
MTRDGQTSFEEEVLSDRADRLMNLLKNWETAEESYKMAEVGKLTKARKDAKQAVMDAIDVGDNQAHRYRLGPYVIPVRPPASPKDIAFITCGQASDQFDS